MHGQLKKNLLKATATPLSSIFGIGFLVFVPILAGAVGVWSVPAMAIICALDFATGSIIRYNIKNVEPVLAGKPSEMTLSFERASDLALILAYVISVCLYLHILSSFVLGSLSLDTGLNEDILTTIIILAIMAIGVTEGLGELSFLEKWALYITLLIIAVLIIGFGLRDFESYRSASGFTWFKPLSDSPWKVVTIVAGTLIGVQGFETPRYLGDDFDADTRIRSSRLSQIISTVVYLVFIAVSMPLVHKLNGHYNDNSLIKLTGFASSFLIAPLVIAAAMSQFSAAVADTLAATGNLEEVTGGHLKKKFGTIIIGSGAIALTWSANTMEIVALASRAFAFYYFLQCLVAISVSRNTLPRIGMGFVAAILAFITVFAVPAS